MGWNPLSLLTGGVVDSVVNVLKETGIIKDKDQELKVREVAAKELEGRQSFFLEYFKATVGEGEPWYSPSKLFRPLCSFFAVGFYIVARFNAIEITSDDRFLIQGIIMFWFGGRTIEKLLGRSK